jgi:hypothetical protein
VKFTFPDQPLQATWIALAGSPNSLSSMRQAMAGLFVRRAGEAVG